MCVIEGTLVYLICGDVRDVYRRASVVLCDTGNPAVNVYDKKGEWVACFKL
jgi:hypothetical protein